MEIVLHLIVLLDSKLHAQSTRREAEALQQSRDCGCSLRTGMALSKPW
jgi:hypothetical protein